MTKDDKSQTENASQPVKKARGNMGVLFACLFMVAGMAGLSFAAVPLYRIFCQVTGYGGTTQRAELTDDIKILDREMTVRFAANVNKNTGLVFKPVQRSVKVKIGEKVQVLYRAENLTDTEFKGTATFNVTPQQTGAFFNKIECFCFTETIVKPGEKLDMPVVFFIDPDIDNNVESDRINTITLSYTMFDEKEDDDAEEDVHAALSDANVTQKEQVQ